MRPAIAEQKGSIFIPEPFQASKAHQGVSVPGGGAHVPDPILKRHPTGADGFTCQSVQGEA
jgi:hypothetical protein